MVLGVEDGVWVSVRDVPAAAHRPVAGEVGRVPDRAAAAARAPRRTIRRR